MFEDNTNNHGIGPENQLITSHSVENKIYTIRNQQVMLDRDLAKMYGVETRAFNQAVKRNHVRFPVDFMFQITEKEADNMVSQNVIPSKKHLGGHLPFAFTEHGCLMAATILNSETAVKISLNIIRVFNKIKGIPHESYNFSIDQKIQQQEQRIYDLENDLSELKTKLLRKPPISKNPDSKGLYTVKFIAAGFGMTANALNKYLSDKKVQYKQGGIWYLKVDYIDRKYVEYVKGTHMKWTLNGKIFIELLKNGQIDIPF